VFNRDVTLRQQTFKTSRAEAKQSLGRSFLNLEEHKASWKHEGINKLSSLIAMALVTKTSA